MSTHVMTGTAAHDIATGERVAAVMASESEVCHKWAAGRQDHARFRAVYFSGERLYSYGSHYVIGWRAEPGVVLLNSEKSTKTTGGHVRAASSATRHMTQHWIPDLTRALKIRDNLERAKRELKSARREGMDSELPDSYLARAEQSAKRAKAELRRFVLDNWRDFEPDQGAAAYLLGLAGFDGWRTWHAIKAEGAKLEAKAERERQARDKARALADAKQFGDCSQAEFSRYWPSDSYERPSDSLADGYGEHAQKSFAKRLAAAHKASKAAGYTTRTRTLWARLKAFREYAAGRPARERAADIAAKRAAFVAWRDHGAAKPPLWHYSGRALAEECAALEAANLAEREALAMADYDSWTRTPTAVRRPDSRRFAEDSTPRLVLEGFEREEAEAAAKALEAWRASRGGRAPSAKPDSALFGESGLVARYPDLVERLAGNPWRELIYGTTKAEEESRLAILAEEARLKAASEAEKLEAWRNGVELRTMGIYGALSLPDGSAALRIAGDILETSQGARVPLAEAVAAFQFVKLLRERQPAEIEGEEPGVVWKANGRQVRVGSYALTRVYSDGSFQAGCHSIRWPEIERAALAAGVFEAEPSDAAEVTSSGH